MFKMIKADLPFFGQNFKNIFKPLAILMTIIILVMSCGDDTTSPTSSGGGTTGSVSSLEIVGITSDSVTISWNKADSTTAIVGYRVMSVNTSTGATGTNIFVPSALSASSSIFSSLTEKSTDSSKYEETIIGLTVDVEHMIMVQAFNVTTMADIGQPSSFNVTPSATTTTFPSQTITSVSNNGNNLIVTFPTNVAYKAYYIAVGRDTTRFLGVIDSTIYKVVSTADFSYYKDGAGVDDTIVAEGTEYSVSFPNLAVGEEYKVIVVPIVSRHFLEYTITDEGGKETLFKDEIKRVIQASGTPASQDFTTKKVDPNSFTSHSMVNVDGTLGSIGAVTKTVGNDSINFAFDHVSGATHYSYEIRDEDGLAVVSKTPAKARSDFTAYVSYSTNNLTLAADKTYTLSIFASALNSSGNEVNFVQRDESFTPASAAFVTPTGPTVVAASDSEAGMLKFSISSPIQTDAGIIAYHVYYYTSGGLAPNTPQEIVEASAVEGGRTNFSYTVPGSVDNGIIYVVRVDAVSGAITTQGTSVPIRVFEKPQVSGLAVNLNSPVLAVHSNVAAGEAQIMYHKGYRLDFARQNSGANMDYLISYQQNGGTSSSSMVVTNNNVANLEFITGSDDVAYQNFKNAIGKNHSITVSYSNRVSSMVSDPQTINFTYISAPDMVLNSTITSVPGDGQLQLGWSAGANHGSSVLQYTVAANPIDSSGAPAGAPVSTNVGANVRSITLSGLQNGQSYSVLIIPINLAGSIATGLGNFFSSVTDPAAVLFASSYAFASSNTIPVGVGPTPPSQVQGVAVNTLPGEPVEAGWQDPANPGTDASGDPAIITGFAVHYGTSTSYGMVVTTARNGVELPGVSAGITYHYVVYATNSVDLYSVTADATFMVPVNTAPSVVQSVNVNVDSGNLSADVGWTAPDDPGTNAGVRATITGYAVHYGTDTTYGTVVTSATFPVTLTGLTAGTTHHYVVYATNSAGLHSVTANNTFSVGSGNTAPSVVQSVNVAVDTASVTADPANGAASVTWTAPADPGTNAGAPDTIIGYAVHYGTDTTYGTVATSTTSPASLTGLTAGTTYHYVVYVTNGAGLYSVTSDNTFTVAVTEELRTIFLEDTTANTVTPKTTIYREDGTDVTYTTVYARSNIKISTGTLSGGTPTDQQLVDSVKSEQESTTHNPLSTASAVAYGLDDITKDGSLIDITFSVPVTIESFNIVRYAGTDQASMEQAQRRINRANLIFYDESDNAVGRVAIGTADSPSSTTSSFNAPASGDVASVKRVEFIIRKDSDSPAAATTGTTGSELANFVFNYINLRIK